jgi:hypothetical protein
LRSNSLASAATNGRASVRVGDRHALVSSPIVSGSFSNSNAAAMSSAYVSYSVRFTRSNMSR